MTIRAFIYEYMAPKFVGLTSKDTPTLVRAASQGNAHKFVTTVSQCWADFQRLVYALNFVCDKLDSFFDTFYKMQTAKNYFYP